MFFIMIKKSNRILLVSILTVFSLEMYSSSIGWAEDFYIAQNVSGDFSGSSCANSKAIPFFNTSGNWGDGAGKISAGDTVHFCGTITANSVIQGSGSSGNVITLLFENGAKFSKAHWNLSGGFAIGDAAISGTGISYVTIDGGTNGLIESTNNGTNLTYKIWSGGITLMASSHIEIKNLSVINMYQRVNGSDANQLGGAIQFRYGVHDVKIHHNTARQAVVPIFIQATNASGDGNIEIYNNTLSDAGEGEIVIAADSTNSTLTNVLVYNNSFDKGNLTWDGYGGIHTNCIHIYATASGTRINGLKIYNNRFTGAWGNQSTSFLYLEGNTYSPLIYNNLFIAGTSGTGGNGFLYIKGSDNSVSANNTFIGSGTTGWGTGIFYGGMGSGDIRNKAYNNLFYKISMPISSPYNNVSLLDSDYNVFYTNAVGMPIYNLSSYAQYTFSTWKSATGFDSHSSTTQPSLDGSYIPTAGDTVAKDKGKSLSSYFTTDKNGNTRTGAWDIGAYEYTGQLNYKLPMPINNIGVN